ncbi:MAG: hypothetical protein AAFR58_16610 [Cyanobacteria bacterium J06627_28]
MSISELNHFMTYVLDGWLLFSAGFVGIGFISFASRRIQEDIEAEALALAQSIEQSVEAAEAVSLSAVVAEEVVAGEVVDEDVAVETAVAEEVVDEETLDAARLEEVAVVSEQLAKNRGKQSDTSSVPVST